MKITLHLGAHKTGSTYVQAVLEQSMARLAAQGCTYVPLDTFRPAFTRRAYAPSGAAPDPAAAEEYLRDVIARAQGAHLLLSDENLLGTPREVVETGALYPNMAGRLALIADILRGHDVTLVLCIRRMSDFLRSIYTENLRECPRNFTPVETFRAAWTPSACSWLPVVEGVRAAFPGASLALLNYKHFRDEPTDIIGQIAGCKLEDDAQPTHWSRRRGLSQTATEVLLELGAREGGTAVRKASHDVAQAHPVTADNWTYKMWSDAEVDAFQTTFGADLKGLRNTPGIRMMRPASA